LIDAGDLHVIEPSSAFARSCAQEGRFDVEALRFVDGDDCDNDHASGGGDGGGHGDNVAEDELYMALEPSRARRIREVANAKPVRLARGRAARLTKAARKAKGGRMNHMPKPSSNEKEVRKDANPLRIGRGVSEFFPDLRCSLFAAQ
jgi:hypothetical protein